MQIGKRPGCFSSVCVFGGLVGLFFVFRVVGLPRQKRTIWGTSCFYFILISEVELLLTFFNTRPQMCIRRGGKWKQFLCYNTQSYFCKILNLSKLILNFVCIVASSFPIVAT